jgi:hypothetical protein
MQPPRQGWLGLTLVPWAGRTKGQSVSNPTRRPTPRVYLGARRQACEWCVMSYCFSLCAVMLMALYSALYPG